MCVGEYVKVFEIKTCLQAITIKDGIYAHKIWICVRIGEQSTVCIVTKGTKIFG